MRSTKNNRVIVLCSSCKAPTALPREVERQVDKILNYECWECKNVVPITQDLRNFIYATRE